MPIPSAITAISGSYPDIGVNPVKNFFGKNLFILIGIFSLLASRSHRICFVAAHSQWITTASWADALHLRQPRLVNNPGYLYHNIKLKSLFSLSEMEYFDI